MRLDSFKNVKEVREELGQLIRGTCNINGCTSCPFKWDTDEDGNSCRSDYLMMLEYQLESKEKGDE